MDYTPRHINNRVHPYTIQTNFKDPQELKGEKREKKWLNGLYISSVACAAALVGGIVNQYIFTETASVEYKNVTQNVTGGVNWTGTAATVEPSVVTIRVSSNAGTGEGSGVALDDDGHIVTNFHVIDFDKTAKIKVLFKGVSYDATIKGTDPATDLAVIKIKGKLKQPLVPIKFTDSDKVRVGEEIMAVGSPLGLENTVTTGIVSALNRPVVTENTSQGSQSLNFVVTNAIQTTASINPGNSGGALVNYNGELIGINSSIATLSGENVSNRRAGNIGIGFAIPSNQVKKVVSEIMKNGKVAHAWLGVTASSTVISHNLKNDQGLLVVRVDDVGETSPAGKAGLKVGDHIYSYNGERILSMESLVARIREAQPGEEIKLKIIGKTRTEKTITVKLSEIPPTN